MSHARVGRVRRVANTIALVRRLPREARAPFAPPEALRRVRDHRVRDIVRHAWRTVPAYREAMEERGIEVADVRGADDLARLPLLERDDLGDRLDRLTSTAHRRETCLEVLSGGSSGAPRAVVHDPAAVLANAAHGERERSIVARLVGKRCGYREAVVAPPFSTAHEVQRFVLRHTVQPPGVRIDRRYFSIFDPPEETARRLAEFRPDVLHGFGSYLGELFRWIDRTGWEGHLPRVVTYSSDPMSGGERRRIRERFGLALLSTYQAVEAFKIGFECEEGGTFHVNEDLYPIRLVDDRGREVGPGEEGVVVVSNLVNRATVLLNYRLGDRARLVPGACPCGRSLPRMSLPQGREDDWIARPAGGRLHPQAVRTLFTGERKAIRQYRIVQLSIDRFRLELVPEPGVDRRSTERRLGRKFAERLGPETILDVRWVEAVERSPGGKVRPFVSRVGRERTEA